MTSIDKIEISGVRSFDPNPRNKQTVTFHKPLTVILGKNGAGKTTIIESLLYACTGEMPPGSAGPEKCSFVCDPKAAREVEVKAKIRLSVTAVGGSPVLVVRNFQAHIAKTKTSFTTLDSTIAFTDMDGQAITRSYRASDCDKRVPELLGVSKAILEHVIFCHQEDSNWPLGTPAEVKKKFDEIFAATRYVAALDKLRDLKNHYRKQMREFEVQMITFREHRDQAHILEKDIAEKKDSIRSEGLRAKEVEPKLIQVSKAIEALDSISTNIDATSQAVASLRGKIEEKTATVARLQAKIKRPSQSLAELVEIRKNFDEHIRSLRSEMRDNEQLLKATQEARQGRQAEIYALRAEYEALLKGEREHKHQVSSLQATLRDSLGKDAERFGFVLGEGAVDSTALERVDQFVKENLNAAVQKCSQHNEETARDKASLAEKRDGVHRAMDSASQERSLREEALSAAQTTQQARRRDLESATTDATATIQAMGITNGPLLSFNGQAGGTCQSYYLPAAESAVASLQDRVEAAAERRRQGEAFLKEDSLIKRSQALGVEVADLRQQIGSRESEQVYANRRQVLQGQSEQKQGAHVNSKNDMIAAVTDLAYSNAASSALDAGTLNLIKGLHSGASLNDLATVVDAIRNNREAAATASQLRLQDVDRVVAGVRQQVSDKKAQLSNAERQLQQKEAVFRGVAARFVPTSVPLQNVTLSPDTFIDVLAIVEADYIEFSQATSSLEALSRCYTSFVRTAKEKNICAVCERNVSDADLLEFVDLNERRQVNTPGEIEATKRRAEKAKVVLTDLKQIAPIVADIVRLRDETIPQLTKDIHHLAQDLSAREASLTELQELCNTTRADATTVRESLSVHIPKLTSQYNELGQLRTELQAVEGHLVRIRPSGDGGAAPPPLDALHTDLSSKLAELDSISLQLNDLRRENAAKVDGGGVSLEGDLAAKKELLFRLRSQIESGKRCAVDLLKVEEEVKTLSERVQHLKTRRSELQTSLDSVKTKIGAVDTEAALKLATFSKAIERWERVAASIASAGEQVKAYINSRRDARLRTVQESLPQLMSADQRSLHDIATHEGKIAESRKVLDDQGRMITGIESSIQLLETLREVSQLEGQQQAQEASLTALKADKLRDVASTMGNEYNPSLSYIKLREVLQQKHVELVSVRSKWRGAMDSMEKDVARIQANLSDEKYKAIDKRYIGAFVKVQTTEIVVQDLEKYLKALEKAVQSYHLEKIQHINQLIAQFWRQTYRGSDIDTIEIRSEDDTPSAAASNRSYKYRVIMKRGNSELEMRGRCSAGQKVLASVVIRLALSEAFCCDCGVLALDEPTTNLDEDNARSLASALKELIASRRTVKHFQLVVITHDEQFVRELGANSVDRFYFVRKDREGAFSLIEDKTYDELF